MQDTVTIIEQALQVLRTWPTISTKANIETLRAFNTTLFDTIYVRKDDEGETIQPEPSKQLTVVEQAIQILEENKWQPDQQLIQNKKKENKEPSDPEGHEGSYISLLVGPEGLEPTTDRL